MLEVSDSGIGIPDAEKSRIFDRFYRVAGTKTLGSGLGLSIVRTIAERYGINILIGKGIDGSGTAFRMVFRT
ncbi:sensor histidine kinase [Aestuariispira ectoiniformans]|uniref:sensor histidine kinase n=1 Tax=Aestuariispira ectoiniformans TaxID=2775080 RepID=UPI0035CCCB4B